MNDPYAGMVKGIERAVLETPGALEPAVRRALAARAAGRSDAPAPVPEPLAAFLDTVARHAYRTTDEQVEGLRAAMPEDAILEGILATASGAARLRLDAALRLLEDG